MGSRTRILIVDDHSVVISGVRRQLALAPDFEVVGQASTAAAAIEVARSTTPDVILLDLRLPDVQPASLCHTLRATVPAARVVIFTAFVASAVLRGCLAAGVAGVLLKDAEELDVVGDLRRICSGQLVIDSRVQATFGRAYPPTLYRYHDAGASAPSEDARWAITVKSGEDDPRPRILAYARAEHVAVRICLALRVLLRTSLEEMPAAAAAYVAEEQAARAEHD